MLSRRNLLKSCVCGLIPFSWLKTQKYYQGTITQPDIRYININHDEMVYFVNKPANNIYTPYIVKDKNIDSFRKYHIQQSHNLIHTPMFNKGYEQKMIYNFMKEIGQYNKTMTIYIIKRKITADVGIIGIDHTMLNHIHRY